MSKFKNLKQGDVLSEAAFYKVEKIVGDKVQLQMDSGESVILNQGYVDSFLTSADQFSKEEKVTKTELAELVSSNPRTVMTVNFFKQVKEIDVQKEIQEAYENSSPKEFTTKMKLAVKKGLAGEARTMIGRHYNTKDEFGRIHFTDMSINKDFSKTYDTRARLFDPRTLNWAIINDVKYTVK
jgi:hypothetical protein